MCLLAILFKHHPDAPLVVAANRDEFLERPAEPLRVLRPVPRTLGGRDVQAGGTWLAVNGSGVVAGLTNQPSPASLATLGRPVRSSLASAPSAPSAAGGGHRDPARRSRGELPIAFTAEADAEIGVRLHTGRLRSEDYNPCWLLVGDREALFFVSVDGRGPPRAQALQPGIHVLENRPIAPASAKAARVAAALAHAPTWRGEALVEGLARVLQDHGVPDGPADGTRPMALGATCVHAGPYGTRSSTIVVVPTTGRPRVLFADGPPCTTPFVDGSALWTA
jgi:uncharacterized protein with NRDE domain